MLRAGETVFDLYTEDPRLSVQRFRLTHEVPVLRDRESASVDHYRRLFTRHLRHRFAGEPDGELRAAVIGAAVVAAHNLALRAWLAPAPRRPDSTPAGSGSAGSAELLPSTTGTLDSVARRLELDRRRLEQRRTSWTASSAVVSTAHARAGVPGAHSYDRSRSPASTGSEPDGRAVDQAQPAPPTPAPPPPRGRRPAGVIITTVLLVLIAIVAFLVAAAALRGRLRRLGHRAGAR